MSNLRNNPKSTKKQSESEQKLQSLSNDNEGYMSGATMMGGPAMISPFRLPNMGPMWKGSHSQALDAVAPPTINIGGGVPIPKPNPKSFINSQTGAHGWIGSSSTPQTKFTQLQSDETYPIWNVERETGINTTFPSTVEPQNLMDQVTTVLTSLKSQYVDSELYALDLERVGSNKYVGRLITNDDSAEFEVGIYTYSNPQSKAHSDNGSMLEVQRVCGDAFAYFDHFHTPMVDKLVEKNLVERAKMLFASVPFSFWGRDLDADLGMDTPTTTMQSVDSDSSVDGGEFSMDLLAAADEAATKVTSFESFDKRKFESFIDMLSLKKGDQQQMRDASNHLVRYASFKQAHNISQWVALLKPLTEDLFDVVIIRNVLRFIVASSAAEHNRQSGDEMNTICGLLTHLKQEWAKGPTRKLSFETFHFTPSQTIVTLCEQCLNVFQQS